MGVRNKVLFRFPQSFATQADDKSWEIWNPVNIIGFGDTEYEAWKSALSWIQDEGLSNQTS